MSELINKHHESIGYLELIIGPMYAGKSTELIRIINRYKCIRIKFTNQMRSLISVNF